MDTTTPQAFIFMRVGNHAGESFDSILERKGRELEDSGMIFWGYGGNTLHPIKAVQPFVKLSLEEADSISILMEPIDSKANPDVLPAKEYSEDGVKWEPLPSGIVVTGSKYAVVLDEIKPGKLDIDLGNYQVGVGPSKGKNAAQYIQRRVDKGCLVAANTDSGRDLGHPQAPVCIGFQARLLAPYAVMLR